MSTMSSATNELSGSMMEKITAWVTDNKVLAAAAVLATLGGGYAVYNLTKSPPEPATSKPATTTTTSTAPTPAQAQAQKTPTKSPSKPSATPVATPVDEESAKSIELKVAGNAEFKSKSYAKAKDFYTQAIALYSKEDGELAKIYHNRGRANFFLGSIEDAIDDYTAALKVSPKYEKCIKHRLECFETTNDDRAKLRDLMKLAFMSGNPQSEYNQKVQTLLEKLGSADAERTLTTRDPVMPSDSVIGPFFDGFGKAFTQPNEKETLAALTSKIEANPKDGLLRYRRAMVYLRNKDYSHIFDEITEAVKLFRESNSTSTDELVEALSFQGLLQNLRGKFSLALADWDEVLKLNDAHAQTYLRRATAYSEQLGKQNLSKAKEDITKAAQISPDDPAIKYFEAQVAMTDNSLPTAENYLRKSIANKHGGYMPYLQLALTKLGQAKGPNDMSAVDEIFKQLDTLFPDEVMCFVYKAQVLLSTAQFKEADAVLDRAIKLHAENPLPYANKGLNCLLWANNNNKSDTASQENIKEKIEEGIAWLEKAVAIDPKFDMAHTHLAGVAMQRGQFEKAINHYNQIIRFSHAAKEVTTSCQYKEAALAQLANVKEGFSWDQQSK